MWAKVFLIIALEKQEEKEVLRSKIACMSISIYFERDQY
jgi:hypothetical protein